MTRRGGRRGRRRRPGPRPGPSAPAPAAPRRARGRCRCGAVGRPAGSSRPGSGSPVSSSGRRGRAAGQARRQQAPDAGREQHELVARCAPVGLGAAAREARQDELGDGGGEPAVHLGLRQLEDAGAGGVRDLEARDGVGGGAVRGRGHGEDRQPDRAAALERGRRDEREVDVDDDLGVDDPHPLQLQLLARAAQPLLVGQEEQQLATEARVALHPEIADAELLDRHLLDALPQPAGGRARLPGQRAFVHGRRLRARRRQPHRSATGRPVRVVDPVPDPCSAGHRTFGRTRTRPIGRSSPPVGRMSADLWTSVQSRYTL